LPPYSTDRGQGYILVKVTTPFLLVWFHSLFAFQIMGFYNFQWWADLHHWCLLTWECRCPFHARFCLSSSANRSRVCRHECPPLQASPLHAPRDV
jgi:hypothetical protein